MEIKEGGREGVKGEREENQGWDILSLPSFLLVSAILFNAIHRLQTLHAAENQLISMPPPFSWRSKGLKELVLNNNNISTVTLPSLTHAYITSHVHVPL